MSERTMLTPGSRRSGIGAFRRTDPCPRPISAAMQRPRDGTNFTYSVARSCRLPVRPPFFQMQVARPDRISHEIHIRQGTPQLGEAARHVIGRRHDDQRLEAALLHPRPGLCGITDGVTRLLADVNAAAEPALAVRRDAGSSSRVVDRVHAGNEQAASLAQRQQLYRFGNSRLAAGEHDDGISRADIVGGIAIDEAGKRQESGQGQAARVAKAQTASFAHQRKRFALFTGTGISRARSIPVTM